MKALIRQNFVIWYRKFYHSFHSKAHFRAKFTPLLRGSREGVCNSIISEFSELKWYDNFTWRYDLKCHFEQKCQNMVIWSQTPRKLGRWKMEIWKKSHVVKSGSSKHFQRALNDYHMLIFHQDMPKNVILGKNAQIL